MNSPVGGDAHGRPDTPLQFCGAGVCQDDDGRHRHDMTAKFLNWNVGGVSRIKIRSFFDSLSGKGDPDHAVLQEFPRAAVGWSKVATMGRFSVLT